MGLLDNKVCIVTGGSGSVGFASARRFVQEGAKVMLVDLHEADLKRSAGELNSRNVATFAADVSDAAQTRAYIQATVDTFGKIDVLFSNAGNPGQSAPLTEYPEDVFDRTLAIHARGAFLACKYALPQMNDGGSIIITSSLAGVRGSANNISYITAKHAQIGVMRSVARFAAPRNIRVNSVNPGPIDNEFQTNIENAITKLTGVNATDMFNQQIPFKRHGRPDEIAGTVLYLASDLSTFVTGAVHMADGGMTS